MTVYLRMGSSTYDAVRRSLEMQAEAAIIRIDESIPPRSIYVERVREPDQEQNPEVMLTYANEEEHCFGREDARREGGGGKDPGD